MAENHRSLTVMAELMATLPPPAPAAYDPAGAWENRYGVVLIVPEPNGQKIDASKPGRLILKREPQDDGVIIDAEAVISYPGRASRYHARATCRADAYATPVSWTTNHFTTNPQQERIPQMNGKLQGALVDGQATINIDGAAKSHTVALGPHVTFTWALFDVVQRLPADGRVTFDLLEDLELPKRGFRIEPRAAETFKWGETSITARGFDMFGHGLLPYTFWIDEAGRCILGVSAQRAYLWDPSPWPREVAQ